MTTTYAHCPRCNGRLYEDRDTHGRFQSCLACGWLNPLDGYDTSGQREQRRRNDFPRRMDRGTRRYRAL